MADQLDSLYWKVLVIRCQLGDCAAFEELVAHYQPRLHGFLVGMISDRTGIDDIAQEVWIDVFRDVPKLADPGAFLPWFFQIARNRAFRSLRRRRLFQSVDGNDVSEAVDASPEFTSEDAAAVHTALDQLGPEHRDVVQLRYIEELSYEDIATVTGCPIGTVKSRLHNAKQRLRKIIEGSGQS